MWYHTHANVRMPMATYLHWKASDRFFFKGSGVASKKKKEAVVSFFMLLVYSKTCFFKLNFLPCGQLPPHFQNDTLV